MSIRPATPLRQGESYTVLVAPPGAMTQQLQRAGEDYPDWVLPRYRQLPRNLPDRVRQKASEVIPHDTIAAYDKAIAIESYVRETFTYSTDVPALPGGRDWVDWFLFDAQTGYSDTMATAMTVLLRTQGVPARVAAGFAPGEYEADTGTWLIRANEAHSWVEVYFPRYGWISFEPSVIFPLPFRPEEPKESPPSVPTTATPEARPTPQLSPDEQEEIQRVLSGSPSEPGKLQGNFASWFAPVLFSIAAMLGVITLRATAIVVTWKRQSRGLRGAQRPYSELLRLASWLGVFRPTASATPHEIGNALVVQVPKIRPIVEPLVQAYVEAAYARYGPDVDSGKEWLGHRGTVIRLLLRYRATTFGTRFPHPAFQGKGKARSSAETHLAPGASE